jgi:uncharacterized protein (TIGR02996 family)
MNDETAFVNAIAAAPRDESLRLLFADWLDVRGDPRGAWLRDRGLREWMGPTCQSPIPALMESLQRDRRVTSVRAACERIGEPAVPALAELLKHHRPRVRAQAVFCLRRIGQRAKAAVPALLEALKDPDDRVREQIARALKDIGLPKGAETAALRDALADGRDTVRRIASQLLGSMRARGTVLEEWTGRLDDPDLTVRLAAVRALAGLDTAEVVPFLDRMLDDPLPEVRIAAVQALGQLHSRSGATVALCRALRDTDTAVREAVAARIWMADWQSEPEALGPLRAALADPTPAVRNSAACALARFGPLGAEVITELLRNLSDGDAGVRAAAAHALGEVGRDDPAVLAPLAAALEDADEGVAVTAVRAIGEWSRLPGALAGPLLRYIRRARAAGSQWPMHPCEGHPPLAKLEQPTVEVIDEMRRAVAGEDPYEAGRACEALAQLGPAAAAAAPELAAAVRGGRQAAAAIRALLCIGGNAAGLVADGVSWPLLLAQLDATGTDALPLLPGLCRVLRNTADERRRIEILQAIRLLGPRATDAVADVLAAAETPFADERGLTCALEVLAELAPGLAPHYPRLLSLSRRAQFRTYPHSMLAGIFALLLPHVPEALERLREMLRETAPFKGQDWEREIARTALRQTAARGLAAIGPAAALSVPELADLLKDRSDEVRRETATALAAIRAASVVPHLRRAACDKDPLVRSAAVRGLGCCGDASEPSVAAVLSVLRDENPYIRREAIAALVALKPDGEAVRSALRETASDPDATVRTRSAALLKRIEGRKAKRK